MYGKYTTINEVCSFCLYAVWCLIDAAFALNTNESLTSFSPTTTRISGKRESSLKQETKPVQIWSCVNMTFDPHLSFGPVTIDKTRPKHCPKSTSESGEWEMFPTCSSNSTNDAT